MLAACGGPTFTYERRNATPAQVNRDLEECKREAFRASRFALTQAGRYDTEGITYIVKYWVPSFAEDVDRRDAMLEAIDKAIRKQGLPTPMKRLNLLAVKDKAATIDNAGRPQGTP